MSVNVIDFLIMNSLYWFYFWYYREKYDINIYVYLEWAYFILKLLDVYITLFIIGLSFDKKDEFYIYFL